MYGRALKLSAAIMSAERSYAGTAATLGGTVTEDFVQYHRHKFLDIDWHAGGHGGLRWTAFGDRSAEVHLFVYALIREDPTQTAGQLARRVFTGLHVEVSDRWVQRLVKRWGFTWKKPMHVQLLKYTGENIAYTAQFVVGIKDFPLLHLKYADECHFESRSLRRTRGLAERGRSLSLVSSASLTESYSITCLTTLSETFPVVCSNPRVGTNTAYDFALWVESLVDAGHLNAGDVLVVDNSPVHVAAEIHDQLDDVLGRAGARMILLPTYSPELNPCELVFAQVKKRLRQYRTDQIPFWGEIIHAFSYVERLNVLAYYLKCLNHYDF